MTLDKIEECSCDAKEMEDCPEDKKIDGKCPEMAKTEAIPEWAQKLQSSYESISGKLEKLTALEVSAGIREVPKPEATVSNTTTDMVTIDNIAEKMAKAFSEGRDLKLEIPYEQARGLAVVSEKVGRNGVRESFRSKQGKTSIQEVGFTFTGTHTAIDQIPGVQTVPGGVDYAPLRQYTNYKVPPKGMSSATFYKKTLPTPEIQVPGTTVTESSMTYTAINIAPDDIAGSYFKIDSDDEENVPYSIAAETIDAIGQVVVDYEDNFIANTAAAVGTLTPGLWVNGNTGATITHSDIAGMTLDPSAVGTAVRYLRNQGYLKGGVKPVLFAHPKAVDELIRDGDLVDFVQNSNDGITKSGVFPELYGCQIVSTNSVATTDNTTNDVYHNLMVVPGISIGSVSKRVLNVQYHSVPEDNQVRVTANWRFKAGVIDASSTVRISTAQ
jgi:hypothetical protein